ncbi:MAG: hypothetical protein FK733_12130 [Asgard group archaeon]|nr:hypothetical protein [Asgard group archaeon]
MSTSESNKKRLLDFQEISRDSEELFEIMLEYLKLRSTLKEPIEAEQMRKQAEEFLVGETQDYDLAIKLMKTALIFLKTYHESN